MILFVNSGSYALLTQLLRCSRHTYIYRGKVIIVAIDILPPIGLVLGRKVVS